MHGASERTLFREIQCAGGRTWAGVRAPARRRSPARNPALVTAADGYVESLAGVGTVTADEAPAGASPLVFEGAQLHLSDMVDAADADAENARLTKKLDELRRQIGGLEGRLANKGYVDNAPAHLVEETRAQLASAMADLAATEAALAAL